MDGKKIELHVHLDSTWRYSTLWELARKRNIKLPGINNVEDLKRACVVEEQKSLSHFLKPHKILNPIYSDDLAAVERLSYEYCEDVARIGVTYAEVRFVPQRFLSTELAKQLGFEGLVEVVKHVHRGLTRGEQDFGLRSQMILIALHHHTDCRMQDTLRLCQTLWDQGVAGLDLCTLQPDDSVPVEEAPLVEDVRCLMEEARKSSIFRTIHAGEVSGPAAIQRAYYDLQSNRVGHGYHVVKDAELYARCLKDRVHFECCPYSSFLTNAVPFTVDKHPILRFAEDGANFSLSSDDPTMTGHYLDGDYRLAQGFGLTDRHIAQANINAAKASFLQESEKNMILKEIYKSYGIEDE